MLARLLPPPAAVAPPAPLTEPLTQRIDSALAIGLLLDRIRQAKSPLAVRIEGDAEIHSSLLLEVLERSQAMVIDELVPRGGETLLQERRALTIRTHLDGIAIEFLSRVVATGSERGIAYHKLPFPGSVVHTQKRRFHRATVPIEQNLPMKLQTEQHLDLQGELRDISLGGFSARVPWGPTGALFNGEYLPHCLISLPDGETIGAAAELCHVQRRAGALSVRIGARFVNLGQRNERRIEHLVAALDRENTRRRSGLGAGTRPPSN